MKYLMYTDVHFCRTSSIVRTIGDTYTTRLENCVKSVSWAEQQAVEHKCNEVICLGDFFNKPDLTSEELTALNDIKWAENIDHSILVGNHDASTKDLMFNSINALQNSVPRCEIVNKVGGMFRGLEGGKQFGIIYIPYLQDDVRKTIKDYVTDFTATCHGWTKDSKVIVVSHNDVHCQYGPYKNESGFEIDDIENNCTLFLNGHIHNSYHFCNNGFNIGNLTGQNFNEDAFNYPHNAMIVDVDEQTGDISIDILENPYAFNFYQVDVMSPKDYPILDKFKNNAVVSVRCPSNEIENVKNLIRQHSNIIESKITCVKSLEGAQEDIKLESINNVNHLDELEKFTINQLGDTKEVRKELNRIRNN